MTQRAADQLAQRLYDAGCRFAFGIPGGEVLTLMDALEKAGITFILAKHENAAGFMAEATWHRTGAPGIVVATIGPGVVNAVNSIANAHQDRVPIIMLAGCVDADEALTYTHQVLDHRAVFAPVTKATFCLTAKGASVIADKALGIATEGRPGPVLIDIPTTVADEPATHVMSQRRAAAAPMLPADADLDMAKDWLAEAERPVMIIGVDAMNEEAGADIRAFVKKHQVPFITTYKAKGIIPETHPLCLGGGFVPTGG